MVIASTKDGDYTTRAAYSVPLNTIDLARSRIEPTSGNDLVTYKLVIPTLKDRETISTEVSGVGTGFYSANTMQSIEKHSVPEFGFAFSNIEEAQRTKAMLTDFLATTEQPAFINTAHHASPSTVSESSPVILGSSKDQVDTLLSGWTVRRSNRSIPTAPIFYYGKDVEIIIKFRADRAVGAAVIDRPGVGASPISLSRYTELTNLIGGVPLSRDLARDSTGIREFSVGDAD